MTKIDTSAEAIAKLLDGVTPGPWAYNNHREVGPVHTEDDQAFGMICDPVCDVSFDAKRLGDARFIAAARDLVPALAAERDALRAAAERMAESLRWYAGNVCNCNRHGSDGDMARDRLANDIGNRARAALTAWEAANA